MLDLEKNSPVPDSSPPWLKSLNTWATKFADTGIGPSVGLATPAAVSSKQLIQAMRFAQGPDLSPIDRTLMHFITRYSPWLSERLQNVGGSGATDVMLHSNLGAEAWPFKVAPQGSSSVPQTWTSPTEMLKLYMPNISGKTALNITERSPEPLLKSLDFGLHHSGNLGYVVQPYAPYSLPANGALGTSRQITDLVRRARAAGYEFIDRKPANLASYRGGTYILDPGSLVPSARGSMR